MGRRARLANGALSILATGAVALAAAKCDVRLVAGGSMSPALLPGDVAIVARGSRDLRVGDVALFDKAGWPGGVLHRIVREGPPGMFVTRGDANAVADATAVRRAAVLGKVVFVAPIGRWIVAPAARGLLAREVRGMRPGRGDMLH
ncbi:MAG: signal peptidase I [Coriobacteriia bacterium]